MHLDADEERDQPQPPTNAQAPQPPKQSTLPDRTATSSNEAEPVTDSGSQPGTAQTNGASDSPVEPRVEGTAEQEA